MLTNSELKHLLEIHGLTPQMASKVLHVTPTAVYRWLNGTRRTPQLVIDFLSRDIPKPTMRLGSTWSVNK